MFWICQNIPTTIRHSKGVTYPASRAPKTETYPEAISVVIRILLFDLLSLRLLRVNTKLGWSSNYMNFWS